MVYRKRTGYRKKRAYRRKFRRTGKSRYSRKTGQKVYMFKRTSFLGVFNITNISDSFIGLAFRLNDVPNFGEFTALYDQFKISAVKVTFLPQVTQSVSLSSFNNPNAAARFYSCIDYNDSTTPTTVDEVREYQSCKWTPILKPHKRYFKPKITDANHLYNLGKPWLSCDNAASYNHFGFKAAVQSMSSTSITSMDYRIEVKYYLMFKTVR